MSSSLLKSLGFASILAVVLTVVVRSQFGVETFFCDGASCEFGSGTRWLLTGFVVVGSFILAAGFQWSARLERRGNLDPTASWAIPDAQQIVEVLAVLAAGLATYWLILNGPSIEGDDVRQVNQWANDVRNFRREDNTATTDLVPARLTWFIIGGLLGFPFAFSFGTMVGREFFGRRRRKAAQAASAAGARTATALPMLGRSSIDIDDFELANDDQFDNDSYNIDLNDIDEAIEADDS